MRVGVFLPNWIGDVVMATPALRAIRKQLGSQGRLVGFMRPYVADVLAGTDWIDSHILYNKPKGRWRVATPEVYAQLKAERLDRVLLFTNSIRTAWIAWRSGAGERIGYSGEARSWLLTKRLPATRIEPGGAPVTTINGYLRLAQAAGCPQESPRLELATTHADERQADVVWRRLQLPPGDRLVILNSGGAFGAAKSWPAQHFAALARQIVRRAGEDLHVLVNCGPPEREVAREIVALAKDPRVVGLADCEQLPIGLTKACIKRARLVVSTDSGPRFLAIAFQKPVVSLFGPTDPAATATCYARETSLSLALECQPCMKRVCPLQHHRCMRDLTVEQVYAAVCRQLDSRSVDDAA